jgi:hypothetical protein
MRHLLFVAGAALLATVVAAPTQQAEAVPTFPVTIDGVMDVAALGQSVPFIIELQSDGSWHVDSTLGAWDGVWTWDRSRQRLRGIAPSDVRWQGFRTGSCFDGVAEVTVVGSLIQGTWEGCIAP